MKTGRTIAALAVITLMASLAACSGPSAKSRGITVAYLAEDGTVKFRQLDGPRNETEFLSTGIMQEGHMPAPK